MGIRGELFTTSIALENRSYFFNVKENRTGDIFLQVVESKNKDGEGFDRHAIVVFEDDMQKFLKGLDETLTFIEKQRKVKKAENAAKKIAKDRKIQTKKPVEEVAIPKRKTTGKRLHVVTRQEKKD